MKKDKTHFGEVSIKLAKIEYNAMKVMCAKWNMNPSQIITVALDEYYRKKLTRREKESLDDNSNCNQIIGEIINSNRGVWGYEPELNDIPEDKKHLFITEEYESF